MEREGGYGVGGMTLLLTIPEAAEETRMSAGFIKARIRSGELPVLKLGTRTRIERTALESFLTRLRAVPDSVPATDDQGRTAEKTIVGQAVDKTGSVRR